MLTVERFEVLLVDEERHYLMAVIDSRTMHTDRRVHELVEEDDLRQGRVEVKSRSPEGHSAP